MSPEIFLDRKDEAAFIHAHIDEAGQGSGALLIVEGPAGVGKSALLQQVTTNGTVGTCFTMTCHAEIGHLAPYGPLVDLLLQIDGNRPRRSRLFRRSGATMKAAAPELLALVPVVGPALKMAAETLSGAVPGVPAVDHRLVARTVAERVLDQLRDHQPAVVIIDDAHRLDSSSCAALSYLAGALAGHRVTVILACRDDEIRDNPAAQHLIEDLTRHGRVRRLRLTGLPDSAVEEWANLSVGGPVPSAAVQALRSMTANQPLLLRYLLNDVTARKALSATPAPRVPAASTAPDRWDQIRGAMRARLRPLAPADLTLLAIAAVQGNQFQSTVVATVADLHQDEVATRLHRLCRDTGLIQPTDPDEWDDQIGGDRYQFEHQLLQQCLYEDQSQGQRRDRHRRIARLIHEHADEHSPAPVEVRLELVRHHRLGRQWLAAAEVAHGVACSLASTGTSAREVTAVSEDALADVRRAPRSSAADKIRAQLIELLLASNERHWSPQTDDSGTVILEQLSAEAHEAARTANDPNLQVRTQYLQGKVLLYTRGVTAALGPLREAWETANTSADAVSILLAGCEYGRQLPKVDVDAGLEVLQRVYDLANLDATLITSVDPVVQRARLMAALQLGVNQFDAGLLGAALLLLRDTVPRARRQAGLGLLPIALNYLAQVEIAVGNFAEARQLLHEAADQTEGTEADGWHAVNLAYLGSRLVIDDGDDGGLDLFERARAESARAWQANLSPLVANLYASSLLTLARRRSDYYNKARTILDACLEETRRTAMLRSEITALSLLGRLHLARGDTAVAYSFSKAAVTHLATRNWRLAAVHVEEILYHHSLIARASGDLEDADSAAARARAEVTRKASSLHGPQLHRFLNLPLNRLILADDHAGAHIDGE